MRNPRDRKSMPRERLEPFLAWMRERYGWQADSWRMSTAESMLRLKRSTLRPPGLPPDIPEPRPEVLRYHVTTEAIYPLGPEARDAIITYSKANTL